MRGHRRLHRKTSPLVTLNAWFAQAGSVAIQAAARASSSIEVTWVRLRYAPSGPGKSSAQPSSRQIAAYAPSDETRLRAMSGEKCSRVFGRDADQVQGRPAERRRSRSSWS